MLNNCFFTIKNLKIFFSQNPLVIACVFTSWTAPENFKNLALQYLKLLSAEYGITPGFSFCVKQRNKTK